MSPPYAPSPLVDDELRQWRTRLLIAGAVLLAISFVGLFFGAGDFLHAWLVGFLFCLGLALGSMAFLMLQYLTGGAWGIVSRRVFEAATRTLPLVAVFFIPIAIGMRTLYEWARPENVRHNALLQHREGYMNPAMFVVRAVIYFAVWLTFSYYLNRWSVEEDEGSVDRPRQLSKISAAGLIVYVFTITFASVDWAQSLQTPWYSTMWGFLFVAGQSLTAIAFVIVVLWRLQRAEPMSDVLLPSHFHDLGKLMLMMVMIWAYFTFAQFLIVWSGNLPHEIAYYLPRMFTSWGWLGVALALFQFLVPFLLLLSAPLKRNALLLSAVAIIVLVMRYMDLVWMIVPSYHTTEFRMTWQAVVAPLGLICIWSWAFLRELPKRPLLPIRTPELEEALVHETE
jgi:hypothetical protein